MPSAFLVERGHLVLDAKNATSVFIAVGTMSTLLSASSVNWVKRQDGKDRPRVKTVIWASTPAAEEFAKTVQKVFTLTPKEKRNVPSVLLGKSSCQSEPRVHSVAQAHTV